MVMSIPGNKPMTSHFLAMKEMALIKDDAKDKRGGGGFVSATCRKHVFSKTNTMTKTRPIYYHQLIRNLNHIRRLIIGISIHKI